MKIGNGKVVILILEPMKIGNQVIDFSKYATLSIEGIQ